MIGSGRSQWIARNPCCLLLPVSGTYFCRFCVWQLQHSSELFCSHIQFTEVAEGERMGHGNSSLMGTTGYQQGTLGRWGEEAAGVERRRLVRFSPFWQQQPDRFNCCSNLTYRKKKKKGLLSLAAFSPSLVCQLCGVLQ